MPREIRDEDERVDLLARFDEAVELLVQTARSATSGLSPQAELSAVAAVAQVRAIAADLVYATGLTPRDVDRLFDVWDEERGSDTT